MENSFEINYTDKPVKVDYQAGSKPNEYLFTAHLPEGETKIQCKKDNEGSYQWLDEDDKPTDTAKAIGESIEVYLVQNSITL